MTPSQAPESTRHVYDSCDPQYLRHLREAAGMDLFVLARTACLSVAQVKELESNGSDSLFYSDAIKRQAYKRLLMILGAEPPTAQVPEALSDVYQVADAYLNTLDQIVAMSHQPSLNRSTSDVLRALLTRVMKHKQALGALLLLVMALVLFVFHGPQQTVETEPATAAAMPSPMPDVSPKVEPPVEPALVAPTPAVAPSLLASQPSSTCTYVSDALPQAAPFVAHKEGRYVYVVSGVNTEICIVDGNKQATLLQLKAGENRSIYGVSPWQVSSSNLQKIQIYFQGGRIVLPDEHAHRVKLVEAPVAP